VLGGSCATRQVSIVWHTNLQVLNHFAELVWSLQPSCNVQVFSTLRWEKLSFRNFQQLDQGHLFNWHHIVLKARPQTPKLDHLALHNDTTNYKESQASLPPAWWPTISLCELFPSLFCVSHSPIILHLVCFWFPPLDSRAVCQTLLIDWTSLTYHPSVDEEVLRAHHMQGWEQARGKSRCNCSRSTAETHSSQTGPWQCLCSCLGSPVSGVGTRGLGAKATGVRKSIQHVHSGVILN
jgi:hypothetical protein